MELTSQSQEEVDSALEAKNLKEVEAALFISARYITVRELVEYTDINPLLLKELLEKLRVKYGNQDSAIELLNKGETWKMDIREEFSGLINRFATGTAEFTKAEQETLAIIAYKQPVKQSVIIKIRGNKAYDHIKHFIDIGLLRAKRIGHTKELNLSDGFYEYFSVEKKTNDSGEMELREKQSDTKDSIKEGIEREASEEE